MGRIKKGILGGFSGKVGTVVGASWRGIEYMRSMPSKRKGADTERQLAQKTKFTLMREFLKSMPDLLTMGYKGQALQMTELNSALSYHLKNAVTGTYPDFSIVYPQVLLTRGNLPNATAPAAAAGAAGSINFSWTDNSGIGKAKASDKAILVAYSETLKHAVYVIQPLRSAQSGILAAPAFSSQQVHTWISFLTEDETDIATSIYTGTVNVL
jgi:hypothetical protein